jgi:hypothetical protein
MNVKLKLATVAAAVATAFAAPAHATLATGNAGSLFLQIWDSSTGGTFSYTQDLGFTINSFLDNSLTVSSANGGPATGDKTPNAGLHLTFPTALGGAGFGGSLSNLSWHVVAADNSAAAFTQNSNRLITTMATSLSNIGSLTNSGLNTVVNNVAGSATFYNAAGCGANCNTTSTSTGWAGGPTMGNTMGNANLATLAGLGGVLDFFYINQTGTTPTNALAAAFTIFHNVNGLATWSLSADGNTLSYDVPAGVPIPGALWLFASGLLGIAGISRRRQPKA